MIPAELTEGMTFIEKFVVLLCAHASRAELKRLREFIVDWEKEKNSLQPTSK